MDAAKFIKESVRMCGNNSCDGCPAENIWCIADEASLAKDDEALKKYIAIVEKWSKEHPIKTNAKKLEEVFGHDIISVIRGYAAGFTDEITFRDAFMAWLGEEYKDVDKK